MLKRIEHKDLEQCYKEDTSKRLHSNNSTRNFVPYIRPKKKEVTPVFPCFCYVNLKEK